MSESGFEQEVKRFRVVRDDAEKALTTLERLRERLGDTEASYVYLSLTTMEVILRRFPADGDARRLALALADGELVEKRHTSGTSGTPLTTEYVVQMKALGVTVRCEDNVLSAPGCRIEYVEEVIPEYTRVTARVVCDDPEEMTK